MDDAYLSCKQTGELLGLSTSTVKRLCVDGHLKEVRTPGGHRRISRLSVEEFARSRGYDAVPELVPYRQSISQVTPVRVADLFLQHEVSQAHEMLEIFRIRAGVPRLIDQILGPIMTLTGERWERRVISVDQEHLVSVRILHYLELISRLLPQTKAEASSALGCSARDDNSQIPSKFVEIAFRTLGWNATSYGSNLPARDLAAAAKSNNASVVWVSYTHPTPDRQIIEENHLLRHELPFGTRIFIGGRALSKSVRQLMSFDFFGESIQHLCYFIEKRFSGAPPSVGDDDCVRKG